MTAIDKHARLPSTRCVLQPARHEVDSPESRRNDDPDNDLQRPPQSFVEAQSIGADLGDGPTWHVVCPTSSTVWPRFLNSFITEMSQPEAPASGSRSVFATKRNCMGIVWVSYDLSRIGFGVCRRSQSLEAKIWTQPLPHRPRHQSLSSHQEELQRWHNPDIITNNDWR